MKEAIFPGSFDPFHRGHEFVVDQALKNKFEKIYIVVSWNEDKIRNLSLEKSKQMIEQIYQSNNKIKVLINKNKLTVDIARELNCFNIIRGYRDEQDLIFENQLKNNYLKEEPRINFILFHSTIKERSSNINKNNKKMI